MQERGKVNHDTQGLCSEWKLVLCDSLFSARKGLQQPSGSVGVLIVLAPTKMEDAEFRLSQKVEALNAGYLNLMGQVT